MPARVEFIVLHCTDGQWGSVDSIRRVHIFERQWADIGYHYVITNAYPTYDSLHRGRPVIASDGMVHPGRDLDKDGDVDEEVGAHVKGWNHKSLGVALVGTRGTFTSLQIGSAVTICKELCYRHQVPFSAVLGHYETGASKSCPDLDMHWFRDLMFV